MTDKGNSNGNVNNGHINSHTWIPAAARRG
jgi:hypothetical protein